MCCVTTRLQPCLCPAVKSSHHGPRAQASAITWFVVQSRLGELSPYAVRHALQPLAALPGPEMVAELRAVVDMMSGDIARADLAGLWRPFAAIDAGTAAGGPLMRVHSCFHRQPDEEACLFCSRQGSALNT